MNYEDYEMDAIKIYEGDASEYGVLSSDEKIYLTINTLFYPGIDRELRTIFDDNIKLNYNAIKETNCLLSECSKLLTIMTDYGNNIKRPFRTIRLDNYDNFKVSLDNKETVSFFSTSKSPLGLVKINPRNRKDIVLLDITVLPNTPCIDITKVLKDNYYFGKEKEVLISPFINISVKEITLSILDNNIKDKNNKKVLKKYKLILSKKDIKLSNNDIDNIDDCLLILKDNSIRNNASKFIETLIYYKSINLDKETSINLINKDLLNSYLIYKKAYQNYNKLKYISLNTNNNINTHNKQKSL